MSLGRFRLLVLSATVWASGAASAPSPSPEPRTVSLASASPPQHGSGSAPVVRALYVLIGVSLLALLYFLVRALRLKKPQKKKYGLLSNGDDNIEMRSDDSEEEAVFEARNLRR